MISTTWRVLVVLAAAWTVNTGRALRARWRGASKPSAPVVHRPDR